MTYINEASVIATSVIFIVLGIVAVSLRWFVRRDRKVGLGADDRLIVVALVWNLAGAFTNRTNSDIGFWALRYS